MTYYSTAGKQWMGAVGEGGGQESNCENNCKTG